MGSGFSDEYAIYARHPSILAHSSPFREFAEWRTQSPWLSQNRRRVLPSIERSLVVFVAIAMPFRRIRSGT